MTAVFAYCCCFSSNPAHQTQKKSTGLDSTRPTFEHLTNTCLQLKKLLVESWRSAELLAMEERGERLKIFDVNHTKAPTLAQITLNLTESKDNSNEAMNIMDWIADGIKTENDQLSP
jgi:hypothetical protein